MTHKFSLFFLIISIESFCFSFELLTSATTVGIAVASYASFNYFKSKTDEYCDDDWINFDESSLRESLSQKLFGQHLAVSTVPSTLRRFYKGKNPKKALVMSFHGLTGSGKNYVASMIANSTYKKGVESVFVHVYGLKEFPHRSKVAEYQDRLRQDIIKYTKECGRSLFIFDEIDKIPPGTLDAIKPFVDYYEHLDGVDYRKNAFIFLSNAGSSGIVALTLKFWADGRDREDITMKEVEPLILKGAFNENGGFQYSELLRTELVDVFVPFLPLEKIHVKKCIAAELQSRGKHPSSHLLTEIAEELAYFPEEMELYSKSGCKRIEPKVDLYTD